MTYYAGIGSRETPPGICHSMTGLARHLAAMGWILRSGGARGADQACENGVPQRPVRIESGEVVWVGGMQIYLPFKGYNQKFEWGPYIVAGDWPWARTIAHRHYKGLSKRDEATRRFMTRNVAIILGGTAEGPGVPSEFVVCWTREGKALGGTRRALDIAKAYDIPVYNLGAPRQKGLLWEKVKSYPTGTISP